MRTAKYQILRALAVVVALSAATLLGFIMLWLIADGGYVTCGKGVFDDPGWPLTVPVLVGLPSVPLVLAVAAIRHCSERLAGRYK